MWATVLFPPPSTPGTIKMLMVVQSDGSIDRMRLGLPHSSHARVSVNVR